MTIDWTAPCETDQPAPRPVRVLFDKDGNATDCSIHGDHRLFPLVNGLACSGMSAYRIRSVNPKPVLWESWVNLYPGGQIGVGYSSKEGADAMANSNSSVEVRRIAWMSDGSPVPGDEYLSLKAAELEAERDALNSQLAEAREEIAALRQVGDEAVDERDALNSQLEDWRPPADELHQTQVALASMTNDFDALKAEFKRMRKNYEEAADIASQHAAEVERMRPVVEAAGNVFQNGATEALWHALRAYREGGGNG